MTSIFVASLLAGNEREDLLANRTLTIIDCSRLPRTRDELRAIRSVPFARVVNATHPAPVQRDATARVSAQFHDYMQALQICNDARAQHAVVFEDDALVAHDFLSTLRRVAVPHLASKRSAWLALWTHDYTRGRAVPPELVAEPRAPCYFSDRAAALLTTKTTYTVERRYTGYGNVARMFDRNGTRAALEFMHSALRDYANGTRWLPIDHIITNHFGKTMWRGSVAPSLVQHVGYSIDQHVSSFKDRQLPAVTNNTRQWLIRSPWDAAFVERPYTRSNGSLPPRGFVGCYKDAVHSRRMRTFLKAEGAMSVSVCRARCADLENPFAAIQFGKECFCSHTTDFTHQPVPRGCRAPCARGAPHDICGGRNELAVYRTSVCQ